MALTLLPILARDLPLAGVLGARVQRKKIGHTHNVAEAHIVDAVAVCREAARANKVSARDLAKRIKKSTWAVATYWRALDLTRDSATAPLDFAQHLAKLLGVPWVLGPLRVLPGGEFEITLGEGWLPATEDLLRALDAERRLGAPEKVVNIAVTVLLARLYDARRDSKEGTP